MSGLDADRLGRYCARIGYDGPRTATLDVLRAVHRAHLLAIPYENLDIHLGRPLTLDRDAAFAKLVDQGRGGWCYEMNGTLGRVLETLGFDVRYVAGAANRARSGAAAEDNHLVLIVTLDRPYIVDVGFGDGFLEPLPLEPGRYQQGFVEFGVSREGDWWRVHNHEYGGADSFVKSTVCERWEPDGLVILRSATVREVSARGARDRVITDPIDFARVLDERFGLRPDGLDTLWPKVWASHLAWLAGQVTS